MNTALINAIATLLNTGLELAIAAGIGQDRVSEMLKNGPIGDAEKAEMRALAETSKVEAHAVIDNL